MTKRPMTKSPKAVARRALRVAQGALPAYSSPVSRHDFTQPQLFAILALKTFFRTDHRGIVAMLRDLRDLRRVLKLSKVPAHTTLWTAERRLFKKGLSTAC
jgi:hypothetical protein